jgi:hypothetical protein
MVTLLFYCVRTSSAGKGERYAQISVNGQTRTLLFLNEDAFFVPDERPEVKIVVHDGRVRFAHSNCPDKICVNAGFLSIPGEAAVCLPNKIVLKVEAKDGNMLDSTTY